MWFERMSIEDWFDTYQFRVKYDIGESAVRFHQLGDLQIALDQVELRYGHHAGDPALREVIAADYPGLSPDEILVTSGAGEAIFAIFTALLKPGDHVIVEHPNYPQLYTVPRGLSCDVELFTLKFENQFRPDLDALEAMIRPDTKMLCFTHPNNPAGSMITLAELERLVALAEKHDCILLFDETYSALDFSRSLPSAATLSPNVVIVSSMSKSYGLPGIRIGWLATRNRRLLEQVLIVREQVTITNNALGEHIALNVLQRKGEFLSRARAQIDHNKAIVADWMEQRDFVEWVYPEVGVVAFPRFTIDIDPERAYRKLAEEQATFVVPGRVFEYEARYFRLGFGSLTEHVTEGLARLDQVVQELSADPCS